ncbi:MAG: hypothetical protein UMU75_11155 [Halomonas sp.]|nr:hypothetical protein [Halomonas sp.]
MRCSAGRGIAAILQTMAARLGLSIWSLVLYLTLAVPHASAADSDIVLIANPDIQLESLSRDTARAIFAMRQRTLPNGQAVSVFVLPDAHPVHARFAKSLLDVYPHQLRLAWDRAVFSGTGQAPNRVSTQDEVVERVASTPGGLGYIQRGYVDDSVRVFTLEE